MDIPSMLIGAGIAMLLANVWLWFVLPRWQARGRRRLHRRTEARLHEDGKRRLLRARDKVKAELRSNGASSPKATETTTDVKNG